VTVSYGVQLAVDRPDLAILDRPLHRQWHAWYVPAAAAIDGAAALLATGTAMSVRFDDTAKTKYILLSAVLPLAWMLTVYVHRAYERRYLGDGVEEFRRITRAGVALTASVAFVAYATKTEPARGYVLLALPLIVASTLCGRFALRKVLHRARARGAAMQRVVIVGQERAAAELVDLLSRTPYHGLQVVGACLTDGADTSLFAERKIAALSGLDRVHRVVEMTNADTVAVLSSAELGGTALRRLVWSLEPLGLDLFVAPGLVEVTGPRLSIRPAAGLPLLHVEPPTFSGGRVLVKNVLDRVGAALALLVLIPALFVIAAAVRATSPGPALFRQRRVGAGGSAFTCLKFRTMAIDAEAQRRELLERNDHEGGVLFKIRNDPRITRVGGVLRRYSLDELPQLVNVLRGEMSLVGPRPPLPEEVARYPVEAHRRLLVKPGLTGLWQVSGRSDLSWEESLRLDLRYVDNWSLSMDALILWKTCRAVVTGSGAY
jgi:exopolysaccharide biosynthesis polyprenyl glycosylphosphotransferase